MNTLNKLLLTTSILFTSAVTVAQPLYSGGNYVSRVNHATVLTQATSSKELAYKLGAEKLAELEGMNGKELESEFMLVRNYGSNRNSTHLKEQRYVTVEERLNSQGQMEYVAQVHLQVHYQERDSNN
ncbi:DUF3316 domain-containing protein [Vibrio alginolyticus]|jgi:hypothetical protein|uniref:DUF3316 domain-containing protein n=1 Tax=Vibrio bivalvicida TaxID=1276888 RepID=A0A177Y3B2_9VIBR|nr:MULTISPECIES: DUF3316 domain-containing protein [Vibrio]MCP4863103.1 DUF3316 domain-containing protein [Alteromonas sp.]MDG2624956.1 DUF3316 domain-containing protein [Vibrio parahaemolyticus]HAS3584858.1 DUF3316 domain-containing protein [Vibrio cholerae]HAS6398126.1 DUF3316 domain-containing protein [Vibrio vulnificus]EKA5859678.1 DUF3316 domain-containing protein [Vibrio alginolyticus]